MKINIIEKNGDIIAVGTNKIEIDGIESVEYEVENFDFKKVGGYTVVDNVPVFDNEKWKKYQEDIEIEALRERREKECFSVINRGELWYQTNVTTKEREDELSEWYKSWLEVTETKTIPKKPKWV